MEILFYSRIGRFRAIFTGLQFYTIIYITKPAEYQIQNDDFKSTMQGTRGDMYGKSSS